MPVTSWCAQWGLQSPGITARWKGGAEGNDLFWKGWREVIVNKATCTGKGFRRVQPGWHAGHVCMAQRSCWGEKSQAGGRTSKAIAANPRLKNVRAKGERERRRRMLGVWVGGFGFTPTACGICAREGSPRAAPFGRAALRKAWQHPSCLLTVGMSPSSRFPGQWPCTACRISTEKATWHQSQLKMPSLHNSVQRKDLEGDLSLLCYTEWGAEVSHYQFSIVHAEKQVPTKCQRQQL